MVLLIERDWPPYEGAWALPGGHVDEGETPLQAAVRELAEETGVHVTAGELRPLGRWDAPGRDPRGRYVTDAYAVVVQGAAGAASERQRGDDHADILRAATARIP
ncbi:NUDIX domain-containing protein [Streptomyces sp. bgisy100]|uniref:NUDIX domain-containing protein n=1 Tax=Streptomyces sp. bgisy100 TaxID=3413783 RepID=UPI003D755616